MSPSLEKIRIETLAVLIHLRETIEHVRVKHRLEIDPYDSGRGTVKHLIELAQRIEKRIKFVDLDAHLEDKSRFDKAASNRSNFPNMSSMPSTEVYGTLMDLKGKWAKKDHERLLRETANRGKSTEKHN